ncbi:GntR family transcriptional regulator [Cryobacterium tepidiphilum]|uniref:GntR family transcriptional regulator n=1 Tax=Cryobacterium tepidiphilum TaxID=2486026 RepID=A0A3M8KX01_9MICO|nr:GntR family transcriptional regulator [Cryobacterium tepidiphilum]RNE57189.1 GntR family transcriptional regulator [Cryobacterium tepidiphilum]
MNATGLQLSIDPHGATPPFEQLRTHVLQAVRAGDLAPGHKLPTVRSLADELGLAVNTVARAYRELEHDGIIETRGRRGSFIATLGDPSVQQAQLAATAYADRTRELAIEPAEALGIVKAALGIR